MSKQELILALLDLIEQDDKLLELTRLAVSRNLPNLSVEQLQEIYTHLVTEEIQ